MRTRSTEDGLLIAATISRDRNIYITMEIPEYIESWLRKKEEDMNDPCAHSELQQNLDPRVGKGRQPGGIPSANHSL